jgi:hypothetical protein
MHADLANGSQQVWSSNWFYLQSLYVRPDTLEGDRIIKSDSVALGVRGSLSGRRVCELNIQESNVHRQKKMVLQHAIKPTEKD